MISYIKGELTEILEDAIVVESGGVGYNIMVPASLFRELPAVGCLVKIYTHFQVKEDSMSLYGFFYRDDVRMFRMLIGVSGIGPKGALGILSVLTPDELRFAVLAEDAAAIARAPGIGKKTAQKCIIELKDKLSLEEAVRLKQDHGKGRDAAPETAEDPKDEAMQALVALGYSASDAMRAIKAARGETVEELIRSALKQL
ncbi:MAG: Holliday junction branch migration protein RuvA [Lachnospiraceae bacterium]|nr:Holliday junction branch migration protein RuvA [Lachnospiraceae bacterium]